MSDKLTARETIFQDSKQVLGVCGWTVFNCIWQDFYIRRATESDEGPFNLWAIKEGRVLFIECLSAEPRAQGHEYFQNLIEVSGGIYLLIGHSDELVRWLIAHGDKKARDVKNLLLKGK